MEGEMVGGWVKQSAFTIDLQHSLAPSTQFGTTLLNVQSYEVLHHSFTTVLCRENSLFFYGTRPFGTRGFDCFCNQRNTGHHQSIGVLSRFRSRTHAVCDRDTRTNTHTHAHIHKHARTLQLDSTGATLHCCWLARWLVLLCWGPPLPPPSGQH